MTKSEAGKLGQQKSLETHKRKKEVRIQEYLQNPNKCTFCGENLKYEKRKNKFCSRSCQAKYSNARRYKCLQKQNCICCEKTLSRNNGTGYCVDCFAKTRRKQVSEDWLNGTKEYISEQLPKFVKRFIVEYYKNTCGKCNLSIWNNKPIPLEIDHIDGNPLNHDFKNLRLICPNCHAQTDTYKAKNAGNGRAYRRERYKEGKSY